MWVVRIVGLNCHLDLECPIHRQAMEMNTDFLKREIIIIIQELHRKKVKQEQQLVFVFIQEMHSKREDGKTI